MSKPKLRARLSSLSFSEKVKILEKLRDRSLALAVVRVYLDSGPSDLTPDLERQKLQRDLQKYLISYLKGGAPSAPRSAFYALTRAWLEGHRGRIRFEFEANGQTRSKEVTAVEELGNLVGPDQTPQTFFRGLGASRGAS
ncbi:MAG TPA: hypothetical protein VMD99_07835 [Terriglobales bacterium]|nr:hypothetical protein [Terriglobales bacterium]